MVVKDAAGMEADSRTGLQVPQGTRARTWQCRKGHRWQAEEAFRLELGGEETVALCPKCFRGWLGRQFGAREVVG